MNHQGCNSSSSSLYTSILTNIFSIENIKEVQWREYRGKMKFIRDCYFELYNCDQTCFCSFGEISAPNEENNENPVNLTSSDKKEYTNAQNDIFHLYTFSWDDENTKIQNDIISKYLIPSNFENTVKNDEKIKKLLDEYIIYGRFSCESSAFQKFFKKEFLPSSFVGIYSTLSEAFSFASHYNKSLDELPTSRKRENITKLFFESLRDRMHCKLSEIGFVRIGNYSIIPQDHVMYSSLKSSRFQNGLMALKFKFFLGSSGNIGFSVGLTPTVLHPFPSPEEPYFVDITDNSQTRKIPLLNLPLIVITAPLGLLGIISRDSDSNGCFSTKNTEFSSFLFNWYRKYKISDKYLVDVNIGSKVYKVPHSCIFLLSSPKKPFPFVFPLYSESSSVLTYKDNGPAFVHFNPLKMHEEWFLKYHDMGSSFFSFKSPLPMDHVYSNGNFKIDYSPEISENLSPLEDDLSLISKKNDDEIFNGDLSNDEWILSLNSEIPIHSTNATTPSPQHVVSQKLKNGDGENKESNFNVVASKKNSSKENVSLFAKNINYTENGEHGNKDDSSDSHLSFSREMEKLDNFYLKKITNFNSFNMLDGVFPEIYYCRNNLDGGKMASEFLYSFLVYNPNEKKNTPESGFDIPATMMEVEKSKDESESSDSYDEMDDCSDMHICTELEKFLSRERQFRLLLDCDFSFLSINAVDIDGSYLLKNFLMTAIQRLHEQAFNDAADLFWYFKMYNYLNIHMGSLVVNFLVILYNNSVCFADYPVDLIQRKREQPFQCKDVVLDMLIHDSINLYTANESFLDTEITTSCDQGYDVLNMYDQFEMMTHYVTQQRFKPGSNLIEISSSKVKRTPVANGVEFGSTGWLSNQAHIFSLENWLMSSLSSDSKKKPFGQFGTWGGNIESMESKFYEEVWPLTQENRIIDYKSILYLLNDQILLKLFENGISGPLTVDQFQKLLFVDGEVGWGSKGADLDRKSGDFSDGQQAKSDRLEGEDEHELCIFEVPKLVVGYGNDWLEIPASLVYLWDKLNLKPYSPSKNFRFYVIAPHGLKEDVLFFFSQLSSIYLQCNFGKHESADFLFVPDEIFDLDLQNRNSPISRENTNCGQDGKQDAFMDKNGESDADSNYSRFRITESQLDAYEACTQKINQNRNAYQSCCINIIYVVNPWVLEHIMHPAAGEASSLRSWLDNFGGLGATKAEQFCAKYSVALLLKRISMCINIDERKNYVLQPISTARVVSPSSHAAYFKEITFNIFLKGRRLSLSPSIKKEQMLYEPPFILSHGKHIQMTYALPESSHDVESRIVHVCYSVVMRRICYCITDSCGEFFESGVADCLSVPLNSLWMILKSKFFFKQNCKWSVIFGKFGRISQDEICEFADICDPRDELYHLIVQMGLVSLVITDDLTIIPNISGKTEKAAESPSNELKYLKSLFSLGPEDKKAIAIFDYNCSDLDLVSQGVLAKSYLIHNFCEDEYANSLYGKEIPVTLSLSLLRAKNSEGVASRETIREITKQYHDLSWLNITPSSPQRSDVLPLHFRVVKRLTKILENFEMR